MNKRKIIIIILIIIFIGLILWLFINKDDNPKIYNENAISLDNKYYNKGKFIDASSEEITKLLNDKSTFLLFVYNNYCSLPIPCEKIFKEVMKKHKVDVLQITFEEFKETSLHDTIEYAPSLIIIKDGKILEYLHADKDEDLEKYQDTKEFEKWISTYVKLSK